VRYFLYAVVTLAVAISLTAIASAVLPTRVALSRWALIVIGVAAAVVGYVVGLGIGGLFGIIVAAVAAFGFVFLYDRFAPK
jgi:hypothetical protein